MPRAQESFQTSHFALYSVSRSLRFVENPASTMSRRSSREPTPSRRAREALSYLASQHSPYGANEANQARSRSIPRAPASIDDNVTPQRPSQASMGPPARLSVGPRLILSMSDLPPKRLKLNPPRPITPGPNDAPHRQNRVLLTPDILSSDEEEVAEEVVRSRGSRLFDKEQDKAINRRSLLLSDDGSDIDSDEVTAIEALKLPPSGQISHKKSR